MMLDLTLDNHLGVNVTSWPCSWINTVTALTKTEHFSMVAGEICCRAVCIRLCQFYLCACWLSLCLYQLQHLYILNTTMVCDHGTVQGVYSRCGSTLPPACSACQVWGAPALWLPWHPPLAPSGRSLKIPHLGARTVPLSWVSLTQHNVAHQAKRTQRPKHLYQNYRQSIHAKGFNKKDSQEVLNVYQIKI